MMTVKPVEVPRGAFAFCRWSLAIALWLALLLRQPLLVAAVAAVLAVSAVTGVSRAPLVLLWRETIHRLWRSRDEVLDERAMRFAHTLGALLCCAVLGLHLWIPAAERGLLIVVVAFKSLSAMGFCTAARLWDCLLVRGGCCAFPGRPHA